MTKDEALKLALEAFDSMIGRKPERVEQAITAIKEALAQPEQAPMNYYRADAKGNLERTDIHFAQPEQDGKCKYCTDGCPACDARKLPEQEPVAWIWEKEDGYTSIETHSLDDEDMKNVGVKSITPLYTTPTQRTWVGLTEEELYEIYDESDDGSSPCGVCGACSKCKIEVAIARAIEAKLKEKNT